MKQRTHDPKTWNCNLCLLQHQKPERACEQFRVRLVQLNKLKLVHASQVGEREREKEGKGRAGEKAYKFDRVIVLRGGRGKRRNEGKALGVRSSGGNLWLRSAR